MLEVDVEGFVDDVLETDHVNVSRIPFVWLHRILSRIVDQCEAA
jgi:hypothetical protein